MRSGPTKWIDTMDPSSFNEEYRSYIFDHPYISNKPGESPDGNTVLYFGLMLAVKRQFFPLDEYDLNLFYDLYDAVRIEPGMIVRSEYKRKDHEGHDDYIGLVHASFFLGTSFASSVVQYGKNHGWAWNNTGLRGFKSLRCMHWRLPGVVQHYKLAAQAPLGIVDRLWWSLGMFFPTENESNLQLQWLMLDLYLNQPQKSWIMDRAAEQWQNVLYNSKKYPNRMGSVFEIFFGAKNILAKWMRGKI